MCDDITQILIPADDKIRWCWQGTSDELVVVGVFARTAHLTGYLNYLEKKEHLFFDDRLYLSLCEPEFIKGLSGNDRQEYRISKMIFFLA